jgi:hypothetical protein
VSVAQGILPENEDTMTPIEAIENITKIGIHLEIFFYNSGPCLRFYKEMTLSQSERSRAKPTLLTTHFFALPFIPREKATII